jgi:predicted amino acid-binding ACT domain protein
VADDPDDVVRLADFRRVPPIGDPAYDRALDCKLGDVRDLTHTKAKALVDAAVADGVALDWIALEVRTRQRSCILQDDTDGIYIALDGPDGVTWTGAGQEGGTTAPLEPGVELEIYGRLKPGGFSPVLTATRVHVAGWGPLPEPRRSRVSRRVRSFPVVPRVSLSPDEKAQRWLLSVSASDRTGLLYAISRVLARHHVNLQLAKVSTLGERVEDTFLVDGPELQKARAQLRIESELLDAVASPA